MSTGTSTTLVSIQEQLLELKSREQALEQKQRNDAFELKEQAFLLKQQAFDLREQEKVRLLELEQQIKSLIHQQHQDTGATLFESFHIEDPKATMGTSTPSTTIPGGVVAQQLSKLDLHSHQLKAVTELVEKRYDDVVRKEYTTKQKELEMQLGLDGIEIQRNDFEKEMREQIKIIITI